ncbi:hypothetical protein [Nitrosospira multiformis]|uniref:Uncharacterized protein n=1 Tax=Nitrosospira multiformis TaxID=1231 RepID=A0A1I7HQV3_9PROT|nr:hypothetical protein [Nitrosospira multiformis]SFU63013.1 hypothetical protein SAMN05216417_11116 [Nitrosospira multiformis]
MRKKTGGSTGEPLVFYTGTQSQSYLWAGIPLSWRAAGYRLGEPVAFLAGSSLFDTGFKESVYYKLMNIKLFSAFELSDERLQAYTKELIGEVIGRSNDLVSDPEGNTVHFMFFNYLFREDSRISSFRFYTIVINS